MSLSKATTENVRLCSLLWRRATAGGHVNSAVGLPRVESEVNDHVIALTLGDVKCKCVPFHDMSKDCLFVLPLLHCKLCSLG